VAVLNGYNRITGAVARHIVHHDLAVASELLCNSLCDLTQQFKLFGFYDYRLPFSLCIDKYIIPYIYRKSIIFSKNFLVLKIFYLTTAVTVV
jgi:hypothetical protein